jgi:hypothetical protein
VQLEEEVIDGPSSVRSRVSMISLLSCSQAPSGSSTVGMIARPTAAWIRPRSANTLGAESSNAAPFQRRYARTLAE